MEIKSFFEIITSIDFLAGLLIFGITTVIGLILNNLAKRKNIKKLSYKIEYFSPELSADQRIKEKISILYNNQIVNDFYLIRLEIRNTGKMAIEKSIFSIKFSNETILVDEIDVSVYPSFESGTICKLNSDKNNILRYEINDIGKDNYFVLEFYVKNCNINEVEVRFRDIPNTEIIINQENSRENLLKTLFNSNPFKVHILLIMYVIYFFVNSMINTSKEFLSYNEVLELHGIMLLLKALVLLLTILFILYFTQNFNYEIKNFLLKNNQKRKFFTNTYVNSIEINNQNSDTQIDI